MSDPFAFQELLASLIRKHFAGFTGATLIVNPPSGGWPFVLSVPAVCDVEPLSPMQLAILEVLRDSPAGAKLTGEELSERAGYKATGGTWIASMKGLIERGLIVSHKPGYSLAR